MGEKFTVRHIDGNVTYTRAPTDVEIALRLRFDIPEGVAAYDHRDGWFLFDVRNWWDGPSEVKDNGNGTLTYTNPWTQESDTFTF